MDRKARLEKMRKDAAVLDALNSPGGLHRIAAALAEPVRRQLDYVGIVRKFAVVDTIPAGQIAYFDRDIPELPAVKIGEGGRTNIVELNVERVMLYPPIQLMSQPMIRWADAYIRRYDVLKRAAERGAEGMQIREDLHAFSLLYTQATNSGNVVNAPSILSRDALARAAAMLRKNRVPPSFVILSPAGEASIRRWGLPDLDDTTRAKVLTDGELGKLWKMSFLFSDQMVDGRAFILGPAEMTFYMPIYKEVEAKPIDTYDQGIIGFTILELMQQTAHNPWAVALINFDATR